MGFQKYVNLNCLVSVKGIFLCLVVGCLSAGIYFLTESFEDRRGAEVRAYDEVVRSWITSGRSQFDGLTVTLSNGSSSFPVERDTTADILADKTISDLVTYEPLKYRMRGALFGTDISWDDSTGELSQNLEFSVQGDDIPPSSFALSAKVYQTKIHPTANQKNCRYQVHGSWRQAHCETYHAVKNICVQVDLTAQGWVGNGKGCHPADGWNPVTYSTVKGSQQSFGHGEPPVGIVPGLDDIQLTIRSSVDPYIDAMGRTKDTGNFGSTSQEELSVGLILIGTGLLLSIPLCAHVYTIWREDPRRQMEILESVDRDGLEWSELNKLQRDNL